jgi:hypothetical protein
VVVRFGNAAYTSSLSITVFDEELWQKINELDCTVTQIKNDKSLNAPIYPNPFVDFIHTSSNSLSHNYVLSSVSGQLIYEGNQIQNQNFSQLPVGIYILKVIENNQVKYAKLIKE